MYALSATEWATWPHSDSSTSSTALRVSSEKGTFAATISDAAPPNSICSVDDELMIFSSIMTLLLFRAHLFWTHHGRPRLVIFIRRPQRLRGHFTPFAGIPPGSLRGFKLPPRSLQIRIPAPAQRSRRPVGT